MITIRRLDTLIAERQVSLMELYEVSAGRKLVSRQQNGISWFRRLLVSSCRVSTLIPNCSRICIQGKARSQISNRNILVRSSPLIVESGARTTTGETTLAKLSTVHVELRLHVETALATHLIPRSVDLDLTPTVCISSVTEDWKYDARPECVSHSAGYVPGTREP